MSSWGKIEETQRLGGRTGKKDERTGRNIGAGKVNDK